MPEQTITADVVVIGGGTAGCALAGRLIEGGRSVLVIEAGPDYGALDEGKWPEDLLNASALPLSHDWGYSGAGGAGQTLALDRCRVIGGCSSHNGTTQNVGWAGDYDSWALDDGAEGWDAETLRPYFARALAQFEARRYAESEIQPFHRALIDSAVARGVPAVDDFDDLDGGEGVGCAPVSSTPAGVRINAGFAYLDQHRGNDRLRILDNTVVDRVRIDGGRATGIDIIRDGARLRIDAALVVLSAGSYGTPEVLLRSGVGPASALAELGIPLVHELPGVGENLHDQPTAQLEFEGTALLESALAEFAVGGAVVEEQTIVKLRSPFAGDAPYDLHLYPWVEPDDSLAHGWKCVIPVSLLRPRSRGTVRLVSAHPEDRAVIDTGYLSDERDLQTLLFGLEWAAELVRSPQLARFLGRTLVGPGEGEDLAVWVRAMHQHYWHPAGSARMGLASDPLAVVDHRGRVHGIDGLLVADASVFPDVPRGTTALPTAVVGERIAAFVLDSDG